MTRSIIISRSAFIAAVVLCCLCSDSAHGQQVLKCDSVYYFYPGHCSHNVSASTKIGVRYSSPIDQTSVSMAVFHVIGSKSGPHSGRITITKDQKMLIFKSDLDFSDGESVKVTVDSLICQSGNKTKAFSNRFTIAKAKVLPSLINPEQHHRLDQVSQPKEINFRPWGDFATSTDSLPDDFPTIALLKRDNPTTGNIYLANYKFANSQSGTYMMVLDDHANVLFHRQTGPLFAMDFSPQPNGTFTYFDASAIKYYSMDSSFTIIDSFTAENGYSTDGHEFRILPNGNYVMLANNEVTVNMNVVVPYGDSAAKIIEGIIQEFDADKNLILEWRAIDHFKVTDATYEFLGLPQIDFSHCNSIELDDDGSFILSSRNMDEVTKISGDDGHIIWRWGGLHNEFTFVNDTAHFSHQHAVRRLPNGNMLMFDNGNFHKSRLPYSRAVEYQLDEVNKIATEVWEFRHTPDLYAFAMGNAQRLENGNTVIGWGACDTVTVSEVRPDGSTALEIGMNQGNYSYRAVMSPTPKATSKISGRSQSASIQLDQNFPNPAENSTTIRFTSYQNAKIKITLYDALGREVRTLYDGVVDKGEYLAHLDCSSLASGTYTYALSTSLGSYSHQLVISK